MSEPRFELKRITPTEWLIHDTRYRPNDARRTVACIYRLADTEVEVVWLRDLPLAISFMTPQDVLEAVSRFHAKPRRTVTGLRDGLPARAISSRSRRDLAAANA